MEQLLHYAWKHRLLPARPLTTIDGLPVEVIDPGLHNRDSGPDFFNAKVKIGQTLWVGNVEIHDRSSDWFLHGHDSDAAYDNVVLHVASLIDCNVTNTLGHYIPQLQLDVPQRIKDNFEELLHEDRYPPCHRIIPQLAPITLHAWMAALQTERLEQKTEAIARRVRLAGGSWEAAYFMTLARSYGFGINGDSFEEWASHIPLSAVGHHRDDLFQVEAIFMGQAGLLAPESIPLRYREAAVADPYFQRLGKEYAYLAHKFSLRPMDYNHWRFLRLRPQNFPYIRLSQLAFLYHKYKTGLAQLTDCTTMCDLQDMLSTEVSDYWKTHYTFGQESGSNTKHMSPFSINLLIINACVPMLFAYGRHTGKEEYCDRAFSLLEQLRPENNNIIRMWNDCGLKAKSAGDSQALIQLKEAYCKRKDCLRCRIGYEYLRRTEGEHT